MESYIELENLRFYAYHGAMEQERVVGNYFEVSITIKIDVIQSAELDRLDKRLRKYLSMTPSSFPSFAITD